MYVFTYTSNVQINTFRSILLLFIYIENYEFTLKWPNSSVLIYTHFLPFHICNPFSDSKKLAYVILNTFTYLVNFFFM